MPVCSENCRVSCPRDAQMGVGGLCRGVVSMPKVSCLRGCVPQNICINKLNAVCAYKRAHQHAFFILSTAILNAFL